MSSFTPKEIVEALDKYIIGQHRAKRAVAIALRNRHRRRQVSIEFQDEIKPQNILMIGPTGVGKTEIARRMAKLVGAPFVKVEATKFTEVGYVGRDVESMVRDLVEDSIRITKSTYIEKNYTKAKELAGERLLSLLDPSSAKGPAFKNPLEMLFQSPTDPDIKNDTAGESERKLKRQQIKEQLEKGLLEDEMVEVDVLDQRPSTLGFFSGNEEMNINLQDVIGEILPQKTKKKKGHRSSCPQYFSRTGSTKIGGYG